jgi:hypothetical protein
MNKTETETLGNNDSDDDSRDPEKELFLDNLPLSLIQALRDPDTDLTPMEVLMQSILAQEEWKRYHKDDNENITRIEASWECVRLLAIKQLKCHPETPTLHACLLLHLQDSSSMPFSLLQQALREFSHQALVADPCGRLPLHITLFGMEARRRKCRAHDTPGNSLKDDSDDEEDGIQDLLTLIKKVLQINPAAAREQDPEGRLPMDIAIATEYYELACLFAQSKSSI